MQPMQTITFTDKQDRTTHVQFTTDTYGRVIVRHLGPGLKMVPYPTGTIGSVISGRAPHTT